MLFGSRSLSQAFLNGIAAAAFPSFVCGKTEEVRMLGGAGYEARTHDIQLGNLTGDAVFPAKKASKPFTEPALDPAASDGETNRCRRSADTLTLYTTEAVS